MNSLISLLRDKRNSRKAEREKIEAEQGLYHRELFTDLEALKGEVSACTETINKNLNILTGHRHTISKVVYESEQCTGLPISNALHSKALDFLLDAVDLVSDKDDLYRNESSTDKRVDASKLSTDAQLCAQTTADSLKAIKSSTDKTETLMNNIHLIAIECDKEDPGDLETSLFYE